MKKSKLRKDSLQQNREKSLAPYEYGSLVFTLGKRNSSAIFLIVQKIISLSEQTVDPIPAWEILSAVEHRLYPYLLNTDVRYFMQLNLSYTNQKSFCLQISIVVLYLDIYTYRIFIHSSSTQFCSCSSHRSGKFSTNTPGQTAQH